MVGIGGLRKTTLIDYPGQVAATVFLTGCNFRCSFCYSSELVLPEKIKKQPKISEKELFDFLRKRRGLLEGIVICGGEPTCNEDLPEFIRKIKEMGFSVKLDTNGSNPEMLKKLIDEKLVDYVAMDIKAPKEKYDKITGVKVRVQNIEESIRILKEGTVDYEFRITVVPTLHSREDIIEIAKWIGPAKRFFLQNFRAEKTIDSNLEKVKPCPIEFLKELKKEISPYFEICQIR